jgi:hypothetical protein
MSYSTRQGWEKNGLLNSQMESLPLHIRKLAREIFAGATGFSGPEIHEFFREYSPALPGYTGGASRYYDLAHNEAPFGAVL